MDACILLIAPREEPALVLADLLRGTGYRVRVGATLPPHSPLDDIDLILFDALPGHSLPNTALPLLILTDEDLAALPPGAVYLRKPVSPAQLLGHLAVLLRAGQALRDAEARYQSLVEALPICLFRKDLAGCFTFVNAPFCRELGRKPAEILGRTDHDFYPPDLADKYTRDDRAVIASGQPFKCVEQNVTPDGGRRFVEVIKAPLRDARGQVIGVQGIFWDVTARRLAEQELARTSSDLCCARKVQQRLFPAPRSPVVVEALANGLEVAGASYPAEGVGGDYFDFFRLGEKQLAVAVGDVSGHGIAPALLMATARSYLRASARASGEPGEALARVNLLLADDLEGDRFITLVVVCIDPATRLVRYASAGHSTGYIFNGEGQVKCELPSTGVPLGIHLPNHYATHEVGRLDDGDLVVLLTDGITEGRDPERQSFGARRVLELVRVYHQAPAREIAANLYHAVRAFAQNYPQMDDITTAVIRARRHTPREAPGSAGA